MFEAVKKLFGSEEQSTEEQLMAIETQNMVDEAVLINHDLVIQKYPQINRMYDGKHWEELIDGTPDDRLEGYSRLKHNFIADIIDRWTMFIGANPPAISVQTFSEYAITGDVTPVEEDQQVEEDEAEAVKKIILRCIKQKNNPWRAMFLRIAHTQSRYGRFMLYPHLVSGAHYPITEILKPEESFPVFDSKDYQTLLYFVYRKLVDRGKLAQQLGIEKEILPIETEQFPQKNDLTDRERTYVYTVLTDKDIRTYTRAANGVVGRLWKVDKHDYQCVPIFMGQNRITPFDAAGKDDVSNSFSDQKAYNNTYSNLVDAAEDRIIGKRLIKKPGQTTDMSKLMDRMQRHVIIGPDTEITDLHPDISLNDIIASMNVIKQNIEDDTGITELLKGRFNGSIATGVALSGLSRGIEDIAKEKIMNISQALEQTFNFQLWLLKTFRGTDPDSGKKYSEIIKRDWYNFDFYWDNLGIQDERTLASTMIDMKNAGLISGVSAMKRMRVQYPEDEQTRVAYEKMNPMLNPELAIQLAMKGMQNQEFNPDQEHMNAKRENANLLRAIEQPVNETNPGQHAIHLMDHKEVIKLARGKARTMLEKHIREHEAGINSSAAPAPQGGGGEAPAVPNQMASPDLGAPRPMAQPGVGNPQEMMQ